MNQTHLKAIAATVVIALAVVAGYAANAVHQKRAQLEQITALVSAASDQLRSALETGVGEGDLGKADAHLEALRGMKTSRQRLLADEAEGYLISVRSIVRARGNTQRLTRESAADRQALVAHMGTRRNDAWFRHAIELKKRVETDHHDLAAAYKALDDVLFLIPTDTKRLSPHVGAGLLVDDDLTARARKRFQAEADQAAAQLAEIRRMPDR